MTKIREQKKFIFDFTGNNRLNVTVIGVGDWGCDVLESFVNQGCRFVLSIAIPTKGSHSYSRHPATRVISVGHDDNIWAEGALKHLLEECDLLFCIFSGEDRNDTNAVYNICKLAGREHGCRSIAITDSCDKALGVDHREMFNSVISVGNVESNQAHQFITGYLSTAINIFFNHKFIGIEYIDLVNLTSDRTSYNITGFFKFNVDPNRLDKISEVLHENLSPLPHRSIVCIEYSRNSMANMKINQLMFDILGFSTIVSYVPNEECIDTVRITFIGFM